MSSLRTASTIYRLNPLDYPVQADLAETTLNALTFANTLLTTCEHAHSPFKLERFSSLLTEEGIMSRLRHPLFTHYAAFNTCTDR